jgi:hypothetical protein
MGEPPEAWPTKKTFTPPPPEECKKDMLAMVKVTRVWSGLWYPPSADTRAKLERVYGYVYTFLARARKLDNFTPIAVRTRGTGKEAVTTHGPPAEQYREAARLCLLQDAQVGIQKEGLEGLTTETRAYDVEGFTKRKIITLGGRQKNYLGWHTTKEFCPSCRLATPCPGCTWKRPTGWTTRVSTRWS